MTDFLQFLNHADASTLKQVAGVNQALAEHIIAARPFLKAEDCLKVKGMGRALYARLQAFAEAQADVSENRSMPPATKEAASLVVAKDPIEGENAREDGFFQRFGRAFSIFLKSLVRLVMLLLLFAVIGAGFYYGLPYVDRTFMQPLARNSAQINQLENEIAQLQTQVADLNSRVGALEDSTEALGASIQKLEDMQNTLEKQIQGNQDAALVELKHEVMFSRALDTLARARLYLAQSNFGAAKADIQSARDLLAELNTEKPDAAVEQAMQRLEFALGNLPQFPVVAAGDLEIAWQILMMGEAVNQAPAPAP